MSQIIKDDDFEGGDCTMEGAETVPIGHQGASCKLLLFLPKPEEHP